MKYKNTRRLIMPEIYECIYGLAQLLRLLPKEDKKFEKELNDYECQTFDDMENNRVKLFQEFGYCN